MTTVFLTAHRVPKTGAPLSECEDATSPTPEEAGIRPLPAEGLAVAVADGATTYSYSQEWARIICTEQARQPLVDAADLMTQLPIWQETWRQIIQDRVAEMPWFAAAKAEQGAFSTFLQLAIFPDGTWQALAVGDSCLVQCRNGKLVGREGKYPVYFPLQKSESFRENPHLLPTRKDFNSRLVDHIHEMQGKWRAGDEFLLMTDALAAWFIQEYEQGRFAQDKLRAFYSYNSDLERCLETTQSEHRQGEVSIDPHSDSETFWKSYWEKYGPIGLEDKLGIFESGIPRCLPNDLNAAFQIWVEDTKQTGNLKDDDISFVHVSLREDRADA